MTTPSEKLRERWLEALLPLVPDMGWTEVSAKQAARNAEISTGEQALAAPNGLTDLMNHFFDRAADGMLERLASENLGAMRTHERVAAGIRAWLDGLEPHKEAIRKAAGRGLLPWGTGAAVKQVWSTADAIWEAAGDTATDYNRQTKRALLSAVLPPIVLHWLDQDDSAEVDRFIAARLQSAMKLGQTGSQFVKPFLDFAEQIRARQKARNSQ
ncbi:MAG: COQ9 family protein [Pseudomonadota bacterium]